MTPKEHVDLSVYPSVDISYKSAKEHYSGQVAALMDKLSKSKTSEKAKAMNPQDFKWSLVFNRAEDPPTVQDPQLFTSILCANSQHWLKARGGGWKNYEEIDVVPQQIRANYERRANLICHQRKAAAAGATNHEENGQDRTKLLADNLLEAFTLLARECQDDRLVAIAKTAVGMLIEDVLE